MVYKNPTRQSARADQNTFSGHPGYTEGHTFQGQTDGAIPLGVADMGTATLDKRIRRVVTTLPPLFGPDEDKYIGDARIAV